jgi:hypothetical protein
VKTTIELPDAMLLAAKRYAAAHDITLREVIEAGLRSVMASERQAKEPFRLKRCAFRGKGPSQDLDWKQVREKMYGGRGA